MRKRRMAGILLACVWVWFCFQYQMVQAASYQKGDGHHAITLRRIPVTAEVGEQIARAYLNENALRYGVTVSDVNQLVVDINFADEDSGNRYVKFIQTLGGIPVYNAMLNVTLRADGSVLFVGDRAIGNSVERINTLTPKLSDTEAIAAAASALGLSYDGDSVIVQQRVDTPEQRAEFAGGDLSQRPISVRLTYHPMPDGSFRLAWRLDIFERSGDHWWDAQVDALTGDLLAQDDRVISDEWGTQDVARPESNVVSVPLNAAVTTTSPKMAGTYRVYAMPVESPNHSTPPAPADGRSLVANPDHPTASPFGWHDTDGIAGAEFTTTQGNNVYAYSDTDANNVPDSGSSPDGGAGLVFDSPLDLTQTPDAYRPAAVTNLFYWANILHDVAYIHGFTEEARNFQENNYGHGGESGDSIHMEAQDGALTNNARYFHAPDGTNPSVEMFLWTPPNPDRDGDLDSGIVLHEIGHGISLRLTGNGESCLTNAEQMGEGWSDFQSVMLTQRPEDTAGMPRGLGTYVIGQPVDGVGVRPAPYTTDMAVNDYTYGDLPTLVGGSPLGFLWNTMLWDLNWALIDEHSYTPDMHGDWTTGGNTLTYRLVHDGMKIQPCLPGFVDGRDAILAADDALTGGENECIIWTAFARRGLGFSASQGSPNSTTDGTEAFDLPTQCAQPTAIALDQFVAPATNKNALFLGVGSLLLFAGIAFIVKRK